MGADRIELITRVEHRRQWSVEDKLGLVGETHEDGKSSRLWPRRMGSRGDVRFRQAG